MPATGMQDEPSRGYPRVCTLSLSRGSGCRGAAAALPQQRVLLRTWDFYPKRLCKPGSAPQPGLASPTGRFPGKSELAPKSHPKHHHKVHLGPGQGSSRPDPWAASARPRSRYESITHPHRTNPYLYFIYIASLSAGMWLKSIGFVHNFIVFLGSGKWQTSQLSLAEGVKHSSPLTAMGPQPVGFPDAQDSYQLPGNEGAADGGPKPK